MSSYIKLHTTETTLLLIFICSFLWLMGTTAILPPSIGPTVGSAGYFVIIIVGFLFMELYCREMANPYPYYMMIIRPNNDIANLFVLADKTRKLELGEVQAAYFPLAYKAQLPVMGANGLTYMNTDKVLIHYHGEWTGHAHNRPGIGTFRGYSVRHPSTEILEVKIMEHSPFSIEFGESIPVFELIMGSQDVVPDVDIVNIDTKLLGKKISPNDLKALLLQNRSLKTEFAEAKRRANEWQQKCQSLINENTQQRNDNAGLKQAVTAAKGLALELLLTMIEACHSLDKAAKLLKGRTWEWMSKYVLLLVAFLAVLLFLYFDPQVVTAIMTTLNNPLVVVAIACVAIVTIIILIRRRNR